MCLTDMQLVKYLLEFHESSMLYYRMAANLNRLTVLGKMSILLYSSQKYVIFSFLKTFKQS